MTFQSLRFKEFDKASDVRQLKKISALITKGTTPQNFVDKGINFIKIECFENNKIDTTKCYFVDETTHTKELKRSILADGDILFAIAGATIGKCNVVTKEVLPANTNQALAIIRLNENECREFIYHLLRSPKMQRYIIDNIAVGAQPNLNLEQMGNFTFQYPCIEEQTKIANFLTTIDDRITHLTQKHDLLNQYKKGVMQQIFSQELRFKDDDGEDFPEWEETTLDNCGSFFRGGNLSKSDIEEDGEFSCVHYGELFTTYSEIITEIKSKTNIKNTVNSEYGDILMPSSDVTPAGLAKASCILKAGVVLGGDINVIRVKNTISPTFMSYLLNFEKNKIIQLVSGTTVKHIYIKDIKCIELSIPTEIAEQTKIANFLTAIDDKITTTQTQLQAVKQYKQGLLQQMFA